MKKIIFILSLIFTLNTVQGQIELYDSSEEIVPLRKTSKTIGKCCQLGKAMSKLTGGQILLSASQYMQAQANQLPQGALSLIG